jgi:hypothetical protein
MDIIDGIVKVISLPVTVPLSLGEQIIGSGSDAVERVATVPAKVIATNIGALSGAAGQGLAVVGQGAGQAIGSVGTGVGVGLAGAVKPLGLGNLAPRIPTNDGGNNTLMYVGIASASVFVLGAIGIIVLKKKKTR